MDGYFLVKVLHFYLPLEVEIVVLPVSWGHSSVGRAPRLQRGGRRFKSVWLHSINYCESSSYVNCLTFFFSRDTLSFVVNTTKLLWASGNIP